MTHQEAVEKAVKLLRLAQSSNPNESALAAGKAQEIIDRFKLGALSAEFETNGHTEPAEPIQDFQADPLAPGKKLATWKWRLFVTIGKQNQCKGYLSRYGGIAVVGRPSDVQVVRYVFNWLVNEVERLAQSHCRGYGISFANNFRIGVVQTVCERLEAQRKETDQAVQHEAQQAVIAGSTMALVRVQNAIVKRAQQLEEVQDWMKRNLDLRSSSRSAGAYNPSARELGRKAGHSVRMTPTRGYVAQ